MRTLFLPVVGYLTYQLAQANQAEKHKAQEAVEELARANRSLHEAQAEVRRAERLAALGQLTAGLAHELRNPLGTMKTSAEMLSRQVAQENAVAKEMAGFIASEVDRTNSLITRFLDFARPQHLKLETADITDYARRRHRPLRTRAEEYGHVGDGVQELFAGRAAGALRRRIDGTRDREPAGERRAGQPPGGIVTVKTLSDQEEVEVAVIDRGSGIDPKNIENIFNPFFTTKTDGIGFGLAIISKILDEHGGRITVESTLGEGSVFRVFLPLRRQ